jgi:flagellar biosynthesis protein FlhF
MIGHFVWRHKKRGNVMRLKIFSAKSLQAAMERVRAELGPEAVIVHVDQGTGKGPVRITAAAEPQRETAGSVVLEAAPAPSNEPAFNAEHLSAVLRYHGLPMQLATRLQTASAQTSNLPMGEALAAGLERMLGFRPLTTQVESAIMLIGQPGHGKTLTTARLAAMARLAERPVRILTLDGDGAGAMAQLEVFCAPLGVPVQAIEDAANLNRLMQGSFDGLTIIDTPGINPYLIADIQLLARTVRMVDAEPIWVMGCGLDALEAAELADIFASLGARRVIATRADITRRYAGVLTALTKGQMALAGVSDSPFVAHPLHPGRPLDLAERLLGRPDPAAITRLTEKAAS